MVLGLKTKIRTRKTQLDYIIHIQEIKPWPPTQSLRTLRSVLIQWDHGEKSSGLTNQVVPSLGTGSGVADGRIEFNESIRLSVTLMRETFLKNGDGDTFQKNCIEFNLYEPRRDKTAKGQLVGTAILDFADYGVIRENLSISTPLNCKRAYGKTAQPFLFLKIQPVERTGSGSFSRGGLMREGSMDSNRAESVSALMNEEYAEEAEVASFTTDDDVSSQSSLAVTSSAADSNGSSSPENKEDGATTVNGRAGGAEVGHIPDQSVAKSEKVNSAGNPSRSSSMDLSSDLAWISKKMFSQSFQSSVVEEMEKQQSSNIIRSSKHVKEVDGNVMIGGKDVKKQLTSKEVILNNTIGEKVLAELDHHGDKNLDSIVSHREDTKNLASSPVPEDSLVARRRKALLNAFAGDESREKHRTFAEEIRIDDEKSQQTEDKPLCDFSQTDAQNQITLENGLTRDNSAAANSNFPNTPKHLKSVRSSVDLSKSNGSMRSNQYFAAGTVRIEPKDTEMSSQSSQSSVVEETEKQQSCSLKSSEHVKEADDSVVNAGKDVKIQVTSKEVILKNTIVEKDLAELDHHGDKYLDSVVSHREDTENLASLPVPEDMLVTGRTKSILNGFIGGEGIEKHKTYAEERRIDDEKGQQTEDKPLCDFSQTDAQKQITLENGLILSTRDNFAAANSNFLNTPKHLKSVRSSVDLSKRNGSIRSNQSFAAGTVRSEPKDTKLYAKETRNLQLSDSKIQHLEHRIKNLEGELREAAAIEVSLYSVIAEHGSSMAKVHAPARRLSRLYFHASKQNSKSRRGSAAKSVVSGLALVAKACGNDVPRLTFWLSNCIVLRVIMNKSFGDDRLPISVSPFTGTVGGGNRRNSSPLKWESSPSKITRSSVDDNFGDWENPLTFIAALGKVEEWLFSRIIESLWWQTFTPHMQCGAAKAIRKSMDSDSSELYRRTSSSMDQQQGNCSLELWKKAFKDACERICPLRAGGHDCGCLPLLSRLIMEQLIARLDVAMFNAILRESVDEMPTDPIADPICDPEVLPIPSGKASFGSGAQLKNAIGNWSRWLTDLFGIDEDLLENDNSLEADDEEEQRSQDPSSQSFHLLNALSDLMMLPKDMLLSRTIRKEVCPTFGPPLIRRVLNSFIPDEFCPDPIPGVVLEALNSEDPFDTEEDCIMNFPCAATPIAYQTPSAASVTVILGEIGTHSQLRRSGSSVLRKSQTSDDELDDLDSPLKSIIHDSFSASPASSVISGSISKENGSRNTMRYQLLREVWMNSE